VGEERGPVIEGGGIFGTRELALVPRVCPGGEFPAVQQEERGGLEKKGKGTANLE